MPECFEIYTVYKRRYINTLPFLFLFYTFRSVHCIGIKAHVSHAEDVAVVSEKKCTADTIHLTCATKPTDSQLNLSRHNKIIKKKVFRKVLSLFITRIALLASASEVYTIKRD